MEMLDFPEPARGLWQRCRHVIVAHFGADERADAGFVLGGGTVLAARLGHRTSHDLDLTITSTHTLREYVRGGSKARTLDSAFAAAGLWREAGQPPGQIIYACPAGKVDLSVGEPVPSEPVRLARVDGTVAAVASNRQILTGKLRGRALRAPVRDLVDLAVTASRDRRACEAAINAGFEETLRAIPFAWEHQREAYRLAAREDRALVADEWAAVVEDPAKLALEAVRTLAWRRIDVVAKGLHPLPFRQGLVTIEIPFSDQQLSTTKRYCQASPPAAEQSATSPLHIELTETPMETCIICWQPQCEFSDEHVIPEALGGYYHIRNVCKKCNSHLGSHVDAKTGKSSHFSICPVHRESFRKIKDTTKSIYRNTYTSL